MNQQTVAPDWTQVSGNMIKHKIKFPFACYPATLRYLSCRTWRNDSPDQCFFPSDFPWMSVHLYSHLAQCGKEQQTLCLLLFLNSAPAAFPTQMPYVESSSLCRSFPEFIHQPHSSMNKFLHVTCLLNQIFLSLATFYKS